MYSFKQIEKAVLSKGYIWFGSGDYNLNIVGIRNSNTDNKVTNKFDDLVTVSFYVGGVEHYYEFKSTTDPGEYYTENILNSNGVAILVPGQYRGSHQIGLHQGKYEALTQKKPLKVYRDKNKDDIFDLTEENIHEGIYGINIHRANKWGTSTQIDKWSAGCQIIANNEDFGELMELAHKASSLYGNSFTYTLLESNDI